jgi:hypothetical protein
MTKPISGQYECVHSSGVGLDYFTSRIDRLILQSDGRFALIIQDHSRISHAAQSLINGQQVSPNAPETRREGKYVHQGESLELYFDDGGFEPGKVATNGEGLQLGPNFFHKVSDSTLLPPAHRLKMDMDDIAKGMKIASTLGGMAIKAVKTIQGTIQPAQENSQQTAQAQNVSNVPQSASTATPQPPVQQSAAPPVSSPPESISQGHLEAIFCDQCGARCRRGKKFCNQCGARLA